MTEGTQSRAGPNPPLLEDLQVEPTKARGVGEEVDRRRSDGRDVQDVAMSSYPVNEPAVARARQLIDAHQYVLDSGWGYVQPSAADENAFLQAHSWEEYAGWHLGLTDGATDDTKSRYAFVYGDFRRVHRMGLVAYQYRAVEWRHKEVELAAHDLLQHLDSARA